MTVPSTTALATLALGTVGAVIAGGAALSRPTPTTPAGAPRQVTVARPSTLPCPRGTVTRRDECLRVVVASAAPAPVLPVQVPASATAPGTVGIPTGVPPTTGVRAVDVSAQEPASAHVEDGEDGGHDAPEGGDG